MAKTPNPGILRALISGSLQNGLRLGVNRPLFDRKLLEYLHEQGVRSMSDKARNRAVSLFREIHYSEPHTGSDCRFLTPVFGFFGRGVHRYRKYCFKWLFFQKNLFIRDLTLQFIGLLAVTFFDTYFRWFYGRNGLQIPLVAHYCDHVGEFGFYKVFEGLGIIPVSGGVYEQIFPEKSFQIFLTCPKIF
ncbi:MAG: hypothetical protein Q7V05_11610 [Methanoregula sp.]|nr:hypothetical protein [Methanoregula sp.]